MTCRDASRRAGRRSDGRVAVTRHCLDGRRAARPLRASSAASGFVAARAGRADAGQRPDAAADAGRAARSQVSIAEQRIDARGEQTRLAQPVDDEEEHRRQEDAEQRHAEHAAEDGRAQRPPHLGAGPVRDHQRHHAEDEGERGHHDRPQPQPARLQRRLAARHAGLALLLGELDDQDGVLAGQADQHHEADLREDVDVHVRRCSRR